MNKEYAEGAWEELKGKAKAKWALLGDKDFDLYREGKAQEFSGAIEKAYGKTKDAVASEIKEWEKACGCDDKAA